ncbi:MAG: response regulator [Candidatus Tectomicrobia bacterium]|uniref:Response regulator n=1 Tax=Tectimicrobiota bacterium TaxID=2528274 RepID=A0A933GNZ7_UNCTE|nr:response regulator [Candidatus Tectomicrobia bacterium]
MENKEVILIFEDDESQATTLYDILSNHGYYPVIADNFTRAQPLLPSTALALIDLRLSEKSGIDILQELKQANPAAEAIIITGFADTKSAIESLNLGAYAYLEKPVDPEKLLFLIKKALDRRTLYLAVQRREQEIKGLNVIASDILNERVLLMEEAEEKEKRLARLYQGINLAFHSLDPLEAGKELLPLISEITGANYASLTLVGQDLSEEKRTDYFREIKPFEIQPRARGMRHEILRTGQPLIIPDLTKQINPAPNPAISAASLKSLAGFPLKIKDTIYAFLFLYSLEEDAFAQHEEIIASFADLCAIPLRTTLYFREAEKARHIWESAIDNMRPGMVLMDRDRRILKANKAFSQMVRMPSDDLFGKKACTLVHGCPEPIKDCPMEKACQTGEPALITTKEPFLNIKKLQLRVIPIKEADGNISHFLHTFLDPKALYP